MRVVTRVALFVVAGLALLAGAGFEFANYQGWVRAHEAANAKPDVGRISNISFMSGQRPGRARDAGGYQYLRVRAVSVTAGPAGRTISEAERRAVVNMDAVISPDYDESTFLQMSHVRDASAPYVLDAMIYPFAARNAVLSGASVTDYLAGGQIVLIGRRVHLTFPVCEGDVFDASLPNSKLDFTPVYMWASARQTCAEHQPSPETLRALTSFAADVKSESELTLELHGRDGALVLAARLPVADLTAAETRMSAMAERQKRGGYGEPFSPFTNYLW